MPQAPELTLTLALTLTRTLTLTLTLRLSLTLALAQVPEGAKGHTITYAALAEHGTPTHEGAEPEPKPMP